jgi:hypothetical protein
MHKCKTIPNGFGMLLHLCRKLSNGFGNALQTTRSFQSHLETLCKLPEGFKAVWKGAANCTKVLNMFGKMLQIVLKFQVL